MKHTGNGKINGLNRGFIVVVLTILSLFSAVTKADVIGTSIGVSFWQADAAGSVGEAVDATSSWTQDDSQYRLHARLEHPIPFFPNLELGYSKGEFEDASVLSQTYRLGGQLYSVGTLLNLQGDNTIIDSVLYYEIVDRNIFSFDLGVNFRYHASEYHVAANEFNTSSSDDVSEFKPLLYAKLTSALPLIGISTYFKYQTGDKAHDYEFAVGYRFIDTMAMDMTVYLGFKDQHSHYEYVDGIFADSTSDGVFIGLESHF